MLCPKCGANNPGDATYCVGCGNALDNAARATQASVQSYYYSNLSPRTVQDEFSHALANNGRIQPPKPVAKEVSTVTPSPIDAEAKAVTSPQPPRPQAFCTACGKPLIVGKKFCTSCGAPVK